MILPDFKAFPRSGRMVGIDWGAARIGVAISDEKREFVFTRPQVENRPWSRGAAEVIAKTATDEGAVGVIIGLPLRLDGTESETTLAARQFASDLALHTDLPIAFIDEGLTSAEATEHLAGMKRGAVKQRLDSESAKIILENAIAMIKRSVDAA